MLPSLALVLLGTKTRATAACANLEGCTFLANQAGVWEELRDKGVHAWLACGIVRHRKPWRDGRTTAANLCDYFSQSTEGAVSLSHGMQIDASTHPPRHRQPDDTNKSSNLKGNDWNFEASGHLKLPYKQDHAEHAMCQSFLSEMSCKRGVA